MPIRMRMGDVFDDWVGDDRHVVLLYYFDPETAPVGPRFYEENKENCNARLNQGGWAWLDDPQNGGWWNGADGYRPYRYNEIRDDIYLPWLSHRWYNWETTLFARNNSATAVDYVFQHTIYTGGGDSGAVNNKTYRRTKANDLWELPTGNLQPGSNYRGRGVVAADTGDSALVYVKDNSQAMAYSGIFPFDSLGQASAQTLYMPAFLYTQGGNGLLSKIFVQNAGKVSTSVSATYYGDDGRTCSHTVATLPPWGSTITHPEHCPNWGGTPPAGGSVKLSASQPLAAITLEHVYWNRVGGFNAFSQGSTTLYAPELLRNAWGIGWYSTLHLQNLGDKTANVTVSYYLYGGGSAFCSDTRSIAANRHVAIDHSGNNTCVKDYGSSLFSTVITSGAPNYQPIAAVINGDNATYSDFLSYNAVVGQANLVLPIIRKGSSPNWEDDWSASIVVQNTAAVANSVQLWLYDQAGNPLPSPPNPLVCNLGAHAACMLYGEIPNNFSGSVVIQAHYPVVALGGLFNNNLSDGAMTYTAVEKKGISQLGLPGAEETTE